MSIHLAVLSASDVPTRDDWLSPQERAIADGFRFPNRRADWKLGRFTAKHVLGLVAGVNQLETIEVIAAEDGAPEAFIDGEPSALAISISHREGRGACAVVRNGLVGCDLEAIESRTGRFVDDFFTEAECRAVARISTNLRNRFVALTWSAKESALKLLRAGLRRDTRHVEVEVGDAHAKDSGWHPVRTMVRPEHRRLRGWWRQHGDLVLTVLSDPPMSMADPV